MKGFGRVLRRKNGTLPIFYPWNGQEVCESVAELKARDPDLLAVRASAGSSGSQISKASGS